MGLLSIIGAIILVLWLLGFIFSFGGYLIHILLVVAVIVFIIDFIRGTKK